MPFIGNKPSAVPLTSADITDGIITSAKIADGTIVNADINASAGVVFTKLASTGTLTVDNIQFPATQVASANANTLDDYEEGTFTPTAWGTGNISSASGRYIKIGKAVLIGYLVTYGSTASTDAAGFQSLPFTVNSPSGSEGSHSVNRTDQGAAFVGRFASGTARTIYETFAAGTLLNSNFSTKFVMGGGWYEV